MMDLKQRNVLLLGLAFHLIFFSFQTSVFVQQTFVNSLVSKANNQFRGNAYLSLCITYTVFALSNWVAPPMIALTGTKFGMVLGASTYALYSASFLWPTTWLFYAAAALIGLGAGPLWTAQGAFLAEQSEQATASKNSVIFWSMLQSSLLFGNLFVYFALDENSQYSTKHEAIHGVAKSKISDQTRCIVYGVLAVVGGLGTLVLLLLRDGPQLDMTSRDYQHQDSKIHSSNSELSQSDNRYQIVSGTDLSDGWSALAQFLSAIRLSKTANMLLLSTAFLFTGQLLSFFTGVYGTAIGATSQFGNNSKRFIGLAGIAIGVGEILGGAVFGLLGARGFANKLRRDTIFVLGFLVVMSALSLTFVNLPPDSPLAKQDAQLAAIIEPRLWISLISSVLIGFADSCFNTQIYSLLISVYRNENSAPAFALFKFTQSIGSAIAFLYSTSLDLYFQIVILATMSTIATVCFCVVDCRTNAADSSSSSSSGSISTSSLESHTSDNLSKKDNVRTIE